MIPVKQTRNHDPDNGVIGNCFRACIASILECKIEDIPAIEEQGMAEWDWQELKDWFLGQGLIVLSLDLKGSPHQIYPNDDYYIGTGVWPTGVRHSVVYHKGGFVQYPSPRNDGNFPIDELTFFWGVVI